MCAAAVPGTIFAQWFSWACWSCSISRQSPPRCADLTHDLCNAQAFLTACENLQIKAATEQSIAMDCCITLQDPDPKAWHRACFCLNANSNALSSNSVRVQLVKRFLDFQLSSYSHSLILLWGIHPPSHVCDSLHYMDLCCRHMAPVNLTIALAPF